MDGFIGLAPGEFGFKSYPEYLVDRKIIKKKTVGIKTDRSYSQINMSLGGDKPEKSNGVNYFKRNLSADGLSSTAYYASL